LRLTMARGPGSREANWLDHTRKECRPSRNQG
jgi:hypothetical protein